jgi:hypothetical protein
MATNIKIRVGIVGANPSRGFASIAHIPALQALPDFEISAVCTSSIMIPSGPQMKASRKPGLRVSGPTAISPPWPAIPRRRRPHHRRSGRYAPSRNEERAAPSQWLRVGAAGRSARSDHPAASRCAAGPDRACRAGRNCGNFGAEQGLEKPGCRVRVGAAQMDVIVLVVAHRLCLLHGFADPIGASSRVMKQGGALGGRGALRKTFEGVEQDVM